MVCIVKFKYLTPKDLARRLNFDLKTLQRWRSDGIGPAYIKVGGRIRYSLKAIKKFEKARAGLKAQKTFINQKSIGDKLR